MSYAVSIIKHTSVTDGRTDEHRPTALRVASRGKTFTETGTEMIPVTEISLPSYLD